MCGIAAFGAREGRVVDGQVLDAACRVAARRGPQAWGFVARTAGGVVHKRATRPYFATAADWDRLRPTAALIHFRLATAGVDSSYKVATNNQPIPVGEIYVAHNGTVEDQQLVSAGYEEAIRTRGLPRNDSVVMGLLVELGLSRDLGLALALTSVARGSSRPLALGVLEGPRLGVVRHEHPLYLLDRPEGLYVSSQDPGGGALLPEAQAVMLAE